MRDELINQRLKTKKTPQSKDGFKSNGLSSIIRIPLSDTRMSAAGL